MSVSEPMVVDVTTRSFSVVWTADKASTPQLEVFSDQDGLDSISVSIINVSQSYPHAEDQDVLKVTVTGLTVGTTYYYRTTTTAKDGSGSSVYPVATPLPSVTIESTVKRTIISGDDEILFSNDLLTADLYSVAGLAGHKDIKTTQRYAHLSPEKLRSTIQILNSGDNLATVGKSEEQQDVVSC